MKTLEFKQIYVKIFMINKECAYRGGEGVAIDDDIFSPEYMTSCTFL